MRWLVLVPLVMCLWPIGSGLPAWDAFPVPLDSWPVVWGRTLAVAAASGVLAVVMAAGVEVYALGCTTDTKDMSINRQLSFSA